VVRVDPSEWQGFEWDEGNIGKNWLKHRVTDWEAEEVFFNSPIAYGFDPEHSRKEPRFFALGQTNRGRHVFVAFTVRNALVRVISARDMNARERRSYENAKENSEVRG